MTCHSTSPCCLSTSADPVKKFTTAPWPEPTRSAMRRYRPGLLPQRKIQARFKPKKAHPHVSMKKSIRLHLAHLKAPYVLNEQHVSWVPNPVNHPLPHRQKKSSSEADAASATGASPKLLSCRFRTFFLVTLTCSWTGGTSNFGLCRRWEGCFVSSSVEWCRTTRRFRSLSGRNLANLWPTPCRSRTIMISWFTDARRVLLIKSSVQRRDE